MPDPAPATAELPAMSVDAHRQASRFRRKGKDTGDPPSSPDGGSINAPPTDRAEAPTRGAMDWLVSGWPKAIVGAGTIVAVLLVASVVVGTAVGFAATREPAALVDVVVTTIPLLFSAVGVRVRAVSQDVVVPLRYLIESPVLPWILVGVAAARRSARQAMDPLLRDRESVPVAQAPRALIVALMVKLALMTAGLVAALAIALPKAAARVGIEVVVLPLEAALVALVVVFLSGLSVLVERGIFPFTFDTHPEMRRAVRAFRTGLAAYGIVLVATVPLLAFAAWKLDLPTEVWPAGVAVFAVVGATLAVLASVVVMGGTVATAGGPLGLSAYAFPAVPEPAPAPRTVFLLFALVVVIVAWRSVRALRRERPRDRKTAIVVSAMVGAGFVTTAWVAILLSRQTLLSAAGGSSSTALYSTIELVPALGLALLWGTGAALLPALLRRVPSGAASRPTGGAATDWRSTG